MPRFARLLRALIAAICGGIPGRACGSRRRAAPGQRRPVPWPAQPLRPAAAQPAASPPGFAAAPRPPAHPLPRPAAVPRYATARPARSAPAARLARPPYAPAPTSARRLPAARHPSAALRETLREAVVISGRHRGTARRDHRTRHHARRRPVIRVALTRPEAFPHRRDPRSAGVDPRVVPLPRVDLLREASDRLAVHERRRRHRGQPPRAR